MGKGITSAPLCIAELPLPVLQISKAYIAGCFCLLRAVIFPVDD